MFNIAVFASGQGTNFENLVLATQDGRLNNVKIVCLVVDNPNAKTIEKAKNNNITCHIIVPKNFVDKATYEQHIIETLKPYKVQLIILAGYMRIMAHTLLNYFSNKILNIHPSLLPLYPGNKSIEQVFTNKEKITGVSIHYVNEHVDGGEIILQQSITINPNWDLETLTNNVHQIEYKLYPQAIKIVIESLSAKT